MKKYLMTGMAALAICAAFTSCSKDTDVYNSGVIQENEAVKAQQAYAEAFIATFGQPAANQDWGFGSTRALTRSGNTGETYAQTHGDENGGANMNHNEWADPDKEFGGWVVPDALTAEQKAVVTAYFQAHPNIDFVDPHFRHFFVQQVYKGGSAQAGTSTENITAADNSVYDSNNMNLLTVGETNIHINNYNAGTCSESDVLNNGQKVGGTSHKDQITLMVNIDDTSCFGYHETGSSTHHNNKAALVGWETIDTWAKTNYAGYNGCLKDDWNRSFMGFDLAIKEGIQACETDENGNIIYATYDQAPESPQYAWDGEKIVPITTGEWETVVVGNEWSTWTENRPVYKDEFKSIMGCGWLTTNENFYVAEEKVTLDQSFQVNGTPANLDGIKNAVILKEFTVDGTKYQSVINLPRIKQLVDAGYLPVKNKSLQDWIKVGTSDGYFTDWIVTLTEAKRQDDTPDPSTIRIIAEDLNATAEEDNAGDSDWDFNDVVFDVEFTGDNTATITLQAAGGTLPLIVGVQNPVNGQSYPANEVHSLFQVDTDYMVNTKAEAKGLKGGDVALRPTINVEITGVKAQNGKNIPIYVEKVSNGIVQWVELTAVTGKPAAKIGVNPTFQWCNERVDIRNRYENFVTWVRTTNPTIWWNGVQ